MKFARHTIYNLLGLGLPLVVAIFCIPILIDELGAARFGLLTLIWAVVSYFGLFDLGLGRALTQLLAVALTEGDSKKVGSLVATATGLMAALGFFAGCIMFLFAPWGVGLIQAVPDRQEAINAVLIMALAMPAIVLTSGFRGILEAKNAFGIINLIRLPMGLFTFLGPVIVVLYGSIRLDMITGVLAFGRIAACVAHAWFAWRVLPDSHGKLKLSKDYLRPLCISGGWMTLSNVISPFMGYVDRFIIGGIVSAAAVAYYTTPQEIILRLWIVPGALTAVLFPAFAAQIALDGTQVKYMFSRAVYYLFMIMLPITAFIFNFAPEILTVWIGASFAAESSIIMQVFAFGILINCLAHIPYTLIQSAGAPKITALIHCVQFPFFIVLVWFLTSEFGLLGAAFAWLIRVLVDTALMFCACIYLQKWSLASFAGIPLSVCVVATLAVFCSVVFESLELRIMILAVVCCCIGIIAFREYKAISRQAGNVKCST